MNVMHLSLALLMAGLCIGMDNSQPESEGIRTPTGAGTPLLNQGMDPHVRVEDFEQVHTPPELIHTPRELTKKILEETTKGPSLHYVLVAVMIRSVHQWFRLVRSYPCRHIAL